MDTTTTLPYTYDGMGMGEEGEQGADFAAREGGQVQAKQAQLHSRSHRDHHHADHGRATAVVAAMVVVVCVWRRRRGGVMEGRGRGGFTITSTTRSNVTAA